MSRQSQLQFLRGRAQSLFRLGAVQSTAQVREVILQIDPTDVAERLRLINDYGQVTKTLDGQKHIQVFPFTPLEIQARSFQREHFEYLVRNRQISYSDALKRFPELAFDPDYKVAEWRLSPKYNLKPVELARSLGSLEADFQFVRQVSTAILKLNPNPSANSEAELQERVAWSRAVLSVARLNLWFNFGSEDSRIAAIRLISDVIPPDFPTVESGMWLFEFSSFPRKTLSTFDRTTMTNKRTEIGVWVEDLLALYAKYENASHRHVRLYMRLAVFHHLHAFPMGLHYTFNSNQVSEHASISRLESELQELEQEARQTMGADKRNLVPPNQDYLDFALDRVVRYRRELNRQYKDAGRRGSGTPAPQFIGTPIPETEPEMGRLKFEELPLIVPTLDCFSTKWQTDGTAHDLVSDKDRVYRLDASGVFHQISPEKGYTFIDEELVWLLERGDSSTVKISANDRNGDNVYREALLELPPWIDFRGIGVGPGKVVIVGWFNGGTWCGLMERQGTGVGVRVVHEAREYLSSQDPEEIERAQKSPYLRFEPKWLALGSDGKGECLLIGRDQMPPIRIDLTGWQATVMPLRDAHFQYASVITNQKLYQSKSAFVYEWELNNHLDSIPSKRVIGVDHVREVEAGNAAAGTQAGTMIVDGDWLIIPGWTWYRYNTSTGRTERLVKTRLPAPYKDGMVGQSSIFGIVQWQLAKDGGITQLCRVSIAPNSPADETSSESNSSLLGKSGVFGKPLFWVIVGISCVALRLAAQYYRRV